MSKTPTTLTNLEAAVIGFVVRAGQCTAYGVRDSFRQSPSAHWSGSAGAVYPAIERLEERGLLKTRADKTDKRMRREITATEAGRQELTKWLLDADQAAQLGYDPLVTRLYFSDLIPPAKLRRLLEKTDARLAVPFEPLETSLEHVAPLNNLWRETRRAAIAKFLRRQRQT